MAYPKTITITIKDEDTLDFLSEAVDLQLEQWYDDGDMDAFGDPITKLENVSSQLQRERRK